MASDKVISKFGSYYLLIMYLENYQIRGCQPAFGIKLFCGLAKPYYIRQVSKSLFR